MQVSFWKKLLAFYIIVFLIVPSLYQSIAKTTKPSENDYRLHFIYNDQELDLLHGEIAFYIVALKNVNSFNITYSVPPNYEDQAPIFLELRNDTSAKIIDYSIRNDTNCPNKVIKFIIESMDLYETSFIHFDFWVLVKNNMFSDLPEYVEIPEKDTLPEETKTWLESTKAIQSNNIGIKLKVYQLQGMDNNLITYADKIVNYTSSHKLRGFFWLLANSLSPNRNGWAKYLDAVSSLFFGGSCTGRANLGTALFRANDIPAKNLLVMPTWSKDFWFDMHYICEYYCPSYGWVLSETTLGWTPYQPKNIIILRVNYPEDENEAGNRFYNYGGCEQWFWVGQKNIQVYWTHNGSGANAWIEQEIITDQQNANSALNITHDVYELYVKYQDAKLAGENLLHFNNAILAQKNAIECFIDMNFGGYLNNITVAFNEYQEINN